MWVAPEVKDPVLLHASTRKSMACFGAVRPATSPKFNAETFEWFLRSFLHRVRRRLTLLFLPPYSPQLAPIERVRKLARRLATHNSLLRHTLAAARCSRPLLSKMAQAESGIASPMLQYLRRYV